MTEQPVRHRLIGVGKTPETGATSFRLRDLAASEVRVYEQAAEHFQSFLASRDLFRIVRENEADVEIAVHSVLSGLVLERAQRSLEIQDAIRNANRALINYLSSFRLFLDHTRTRLSGTYGKKSQQLAVFEKSYADQRRTNVAYRLVYELRNYVQHCNLPYDQARSHRALADDERDPSKVEIFFGAKQKTLRSRYRRWGLSAEQWATFPDPLPIHDFLHLASMALREIDDNVCNAEVPVLTAAGRRALSITAPAFDAHHHGAIAETQGSLPGNMPIRIVSLPWHLLIALGLGRQEVGPFGPYFVPIVGA